MDRGPIDAFLLGYIATFLLAKAAVVRANTRLGVALRCANLSLGATYGVGFVLRAWPWAAGAWLSGALDAARVCVAVSVTWSLYELLRARFPRRWLARAPRVKLRGRFRRR